MRNTANNEMTGDEIPRFWWNDETRRKWREARNRRDAENARPLTEENRRRNDYDLTNPLNIASPLSPLNPMNSSIDYTPVRTYTAPTYDPPPRPAPPASRAYDPPTDTSSRYDSGSSYSSSYSSDSGSSYSSSYSSDSGSSASSSSID